MFGSFKHKAQRLTIVLSWIGMAVIFANAQSVYTTPASPKPTPTPYYQPPMVIQPSTTPTPLVNKTSSVSPADIVNPAMSEMSIPGYSGVLIETLDGKVVKENYSNYAFNPASNVKVATAYAVIKTFGPDYRFPTNIYTDGVVDQTTGTLTGNLYVAGRDPNFTYEHAVAVAQTLNKMGIRQVTGDLIVTNSFIMALNGSYQRSAELLFNTLDSGKRSAAAARAWQEYLVTSGKIGQIQGLPSVSFGGKLYVDIIPTNARLIFAHESAPLKEIVKVTLCYSNNFLAEKLGDMLGGAYAVARIVQINAGVTPEEFSLQTSSGLGINRVTPRAQMKLLRTLRNELARYKMTFADVMPIAGMDPGTLQHRFNTFPYQGSVVAKTGTLGQTDSGVSSLTGEMQTKNGKLLFVIFNQKGGVSKFRNFQNDYVMMVQNQQGGAMPLGYTTIPLSTRLANTRVVYPTNNVAVN
ncbi:MAG: D-alanyl-D-alanine carboxypeptidase [Pyrinomonadaceae bacterium]|nr:D-alanyl-D-alanine carboxypeptidase [Pyrinomonadaceae bacterium]